MGSQRGKYRPVRPSDPRPGVVAAEHRHLRKIRISAFLDAEDRADSASHDSNAVFVTHSNSK
jgi:hypothetical protein